MTFNRDSIIAIVLLLACGGLLVASFDIREPDYGQLSPAAWPRAVLGATALLSLIYLVQSLRAGPSQVATEGPRGLAGFAAHWRNVLWVFALFLAYLLAMPWIGMLLGGIAFAFLLLTALGGLRLAPRHAAIALVAVGGVWALFTFGLEVILPRGELTGF